MPATKPNRKRPKPGDRCHFVEVRIKVKDEREANAIINGVIPLGLYGEYATTICPATFDGQQWLSGNPKEIE